MDAAVFEILERVGNEADAGQREALRVEYNTDLAAHFAHPANVADLHELAYDALNQAWTDAMEQDIVPVLIDVKTVGLGEPDYIEEDLRGMRAYWQGKGGQILSDVIRYERAQMPREEMVAAIDIHTDEVRTNFWGTLDQLSNQAQAKLATLPTTKLIELVQAAITAGTYYGSFAVSTLTADQVDSVVDEVAARSGGQISIVGTRIATRHLTKVGLEFGDNVKERIFSTGQIGVYKGFPVVQVENFEDFAGNFVLPNDELWIVGRNAGRLTFYGNEAKVQQLPLPSFYLRWETARDAGMLLHGADRGRIGRIKLT